MSKHATGTSGRFDNPSSTRREEHKPSPRQSRNNFTHEDTLRTQNAALRALSMSRAFEQGPSGFTAALREIAETAAEALDVERIGIWTFNDDHSTLRCVELFQRACGTHSAGMELTAADYPTYFQALAEERSIAASDARNDPRTREFTAGYLVPTDITALLDAPVRIGGTLTGIICHEHVDPTGTPREWTVDEQAFAGSMADFVSLAVQADRRRQAEQAIEQQRAFLRQIIDVNPNLIFAKDREGRFTLVNKAVADLYGTTPEELVGKTDADFNPNAEEVAHFRRIDLKVMDTQCEHVIPEESVTDAQGRVHWLHTVKRPIVDVDGKAHQVLGVAVDITERKLADERQSLMMRELDHRVKNNLASVIALAEMTAGHANDCVAFLSAFTGRIHSMAMAHEVLTKTRWQGANLLDIVGRVLEPYQREGEQRIAITGSSVMLPAEYASPLCMVLHELATNAAKYGALSVADGRVAVSWKHHGSRLLLEWCEQDGPPVREPEKRSFGTELIEQAIQHQLRGEAQLSFNPDGVCCTMNIPLPTTTARRTHGTLST